MYSDNLLCPRREIARQLKSAMPQVIMFRVRQPQFIQRITTAVIEVSTIHTFHSSRDIETYFIIVHAIKPDHCHRKFFAKSIKPRIWVSHPFTVYDYHNQSFYSICKCNQSGFKREKHWQTMFPNSHTYSLKPCLTYCHTRTTVSNIFF